MRLIRSAATLLLACGIGGCTTGVYYVSSRPAPEGDGLYRYKVSDGSDRALGGIYQSATSPHVAPDGVLLYVKPAAGVRQVFRGSQQLTTSPGDKSFPRWSIHWLAFVQTSGSGSNLLLRSHDGATEFTLASGVGSGLAFFDAGQRIAFARSDGIYWANAAQGASPTRIESCPVTTPASTCNQPTVSHDGTLLAYHLNTPTGPGNLEFIRMLNVGTWTHAWSIARMALDPAVSGSSTTSLGSFAFSPEDQWLYVTATVRTPGGPAPTRPDLFRINRDGTQPARLLDNGFPNTSPTTKRIWMWE